MFLQATPPRLTRRNRLEHILLLLLRCVAICLLAAGFARPFVKHVLPETPASQPPKTVVLLVDTSASMRRSGLWSQARDRAEAVLRKTSTADRVALCTFDLQLTPLVTFDEWNSTAAGDRAALAMSRLAAAKPSWAATRLDQALIRASELFSEADKTDATGLRQIVVVSDFQEGSKSSALQGQEWPKGVEIVSERIVAKSSNAGIQLLADANETSSATAGTRVRVSNESDSKRDQFQVGWARSKGEFVGKATEIYVPAGQSRIVTLPSPEKNSGADRIVLHGDDEDFDNTVFNVAPEATRVTVLYVGSEPVTNARAPLYFLSRALQGTPKQAIELIAYQPTVELGSNQLSAATMFVVTEAMSASLSAALRNQIQQGKTVLVAPTGAEAASTFGLLLGQDRLTISEATPGQYAMFGEIDFRHPLFAPFADARYSDFTKIHFWKYRKLDPAQLPNARVVARFDNGDPAILEIPVGRGRVIVFASGWHPADSQLALSTKFVPLLCAALELSGGAPAATAQFHVGDSVPLALSSLPAAATTTIKFPDGSSLKAAAGETNFTQTTMPGIYRVTTGPSETSFAVNLDAAESRTAPLPLDELERLGAPVGKPMVAAAPGSKGNAMVHNAELENRQKLWRWLLAATLGVLLAETAIAGWTARRRAANAEATA